jgi:hypothetical protein
MNRIAPLVGLLSPTIDFWSENLKRRTDSYSFQVFRVLFIFHVKLESDTILGTGQA